MNKLIISLFTMLFAFGCATQKENESGDTTDIADMTLSEKIESNASNVKIVAADSPEWCSYKQKCTYVRDVTCITYNRPLSSAKTACDIKVAEDSLKLGGDTFLYQATEVSAEIEMSDKQDALNVPFRAFGQTYNCSGKFDAIGKEFLDKNIINPKHRIQIATAEKETLCGEDPKCKFVRTFTCSTTRDRAFARCLAKIQKKDLNHTWVNKLVIRKEIVSPNKYSVQMDGYLCEIDRIQ